MQNNKRKKHFIDEQLQGRLITFVVLVEFLLFLGAMVYAYLYLNNAVESQLFRVHGPGSDAEPIFYTALTRIVPWIILVNTLLIVLIDRWWSVFTRRLVRGVRNFSERLAALDLTVFAVADDTHVVNRAISERLQNERLRCLEIRNTINELPDSDDAEMDSTAALERLRELLRKK